MSTELQWFRSSCSDSGGGNCVEVAIDAGRVRVRDSKNRSGPQLAFDLGAWAEFVAFAARHPLDPRAVSEA